MDSTTPLTPALLPAQRRQRDGTRQSDPPPYRPPPGRTNGGYGSRPPPPPPPPSPPPGTRTPRTRPAARSPHRAFQAGGTEKGLHTRTPAPTTRGSRTPTARPGGGQSGEGERLTPDAPSNSRRHPPRGRPTSTPTTPSQVGGNRDRTAPPPSTPDAARDRGRTRGGAQTTWNGPTSAQCRDHARCARHTGQGGGGADAAGARAHTHVKGTRGLREGQPDRACGTHRPRGMVYQQARIRDTRTGRPATRSAEHAGREGGNKRDTTPGTGPTPQTGRERRAHTDGALHPPRQ